LSLWGEELPQVAVGVRIVPYKRTRHTTKFRPACERRGDTCQTGEGVIFM